MEIENTVGLIGVWMDCQLHKGVKVVIDWQSRVFCPRRNNRCSRNGCPFGGVDGSMEQLWAIYGRQDLARIVANEVKGRITIDGGVIKVDEERKMVGSGEGEI